MSSHTLQMGMVASAVAAGLAGGATFAFSNFIMKAFDRLSPSEAVRAMQAINVTAINPLFMALLIGTGVATLAMSVVHAAKANGQLNPWLLGGTVIYLLGVVLVTIAGNVPLNEALAELAPSDLDAHAWSGYASPWTAWNHVRTVAAAVASFALSVAAFR